MQLYLSQLLLTAGLRCHHLKGAWEGRGWKCTFTIAFQDIWLPGT